MASVVSKFKATSKVFVGALGFIVAALNDHIDLVPVQWRGYVTAAIGLATLVGIYHAPYAPTAGTRRAAKRKARKQVGTSQVPIVRDVGHGKHESP